MQRPLTGALLGILIGVAAAVILARQGIWPADQITLFFLPGILGLLGLLLLTMGRVARGRSTLVVALLLLVPMLVWGALGFAGLNEQGQLNGGCQVSATSAADATVVTDTSRSDPFVVDPDGSLSWEASSPTVFQDYDWEIHVVVGGIPVTIDSDHEDNDAGDPDNSGEVPEVRAYADAIGIDLSLYQGVYEVGGSAQTCDGFGFVEVASDGLDTISLIAMITAATLLIILIVLMFVGRNPATPEGGVDGSGSDDPGEGPGGSDQPGPAAEIAAGAAAAGYGQGMWKDGEYMGDKLEGEDHEEIKKATEGQDLTQGAPEPSPEGPSDGPGGAAGRHSPPQDSDEGDKLPGLDD